MLASALITGGAGFIGYHLASFLADRGDKVTICDNLFRTGKVDEELRNLLRRPKVELLRVDLTRSSDWRRITGDFDLVFHLAGVNGTRFFYQMPDEVLRVNLLTSLNLVRWLRSAKVGKVLFASTSELYSGAAELGLLDFPTDETSPVAFPETTNPRWSYAVSKLAGELLIRHQNKRNVFRWSIVRYHNVYGPRMGNEHVIPELYHRLVANKEHLILYGGRNTRCFCYVTDAVAATVAIIERSSTDSEVINVGNNREEVSIAQLAKLICGILGVKPKIVTRKAPLGSPPRRAPSLRKLRRLGGYVARTPLKTGLSKTIQWYHAHDSR